MPKPLNADWNLAQALYLQGLPYKTIAEQVGVTEASLRQRAHRHGWHTLKTTSVTVASQSVTGHTGKSLVERSNELRGTLAEELSETANALRETPIQPALAHIGERAEVSQKLVASAEKLYGWRQETQQGLILVAELSAAGRPELPTIDVEAKPMGIRDAAEVSASGEFQEAEGV